MARQGDPLHHAPGRQEVGRAEVTISAIELASKTPAYWSVLTVALAQVPAGDVPTKLVLRFALVGRP